MNCIKLLLDDDLDLNVMSTNVNYEHEKYGYIGRPHTSAKRRTSHEVRERNLKPTMLIN